MENKSRAKTNRHNNTFSPEENGSELVSAVECLRVRWPIARRLFIEEISRSSKFVFPIAVTNEEAVYDCDCLLTLATFTGYFFMGRFRTWSKNTRENESSEKLQMCFGVHINAGKCRNSESAGEKKSIFLPLQHLKLNVFPVLRRTGP